MGRGSESSDQAARPRVLVLTASGYFPPYLEEMSAGVKAGAAPRMWLFELPFDLVILDQRLLTQPPRWLRLIYRRLPTELCQLLEAFRVRHAYDAIFAWGAERISLPLAVLLRVFHSRVAFVALYCWISSGAKATLLRCGHPSITRVILPALPQREYAEKRIGVPPERLVSFPWPVDSRFWQARRPPEPDLICSAGREMRDYQTLIKAVEGLDVRCHIAAPPVRGQRDHWRRQYGDAGELAALPENVTFGRVKDMRSLYERSRFVMLPLFESDSDNGISCMLEAWAMSRPVICSDISGQTGNLREGDGVIPVPVGDPLALRRAIQELLSDERRTRELGQRARRWVCEQRSVDEWVARLTRVIFEAIEEVNQGHPYRTAAC